MGVIALPFAAQEEEESTAVRVEAQHTGQLVAEARSSIQCWFHAAFALPGFVAVEACTRCQVGLTSEVSGRSLPSLRVE